MKVEKLWGSRLKRTPSQETISFTAGRDVKGVNACDEALIGYDIWGSKAHVIMLWKQNIIAEKVVKEIVRELREIEILHQEKNFHLDPSKEDVHTNIESFLIEKLGVDLGGRVHTGRSRNDQVALDMRLYLRDRDLNLMESAGNLLEKLLKRAEENLTTIMPGFTHHQLAMIDTFAHLLLSFGEALERDIRRFINWYEIFNQNPLGSVAAYGTTFPLDRELATRLLGFYSPHNNSIDPITNRWEAESDLASAVCLMMNHLSTMAQTFIIMTTSEFNLLKLDDAYCGGSSIMPQKRNPASLEVIKAKTALAQGILVSLMSLGRSLFVGYNRDSQWSKYLIMDILNECLPSPNIMGGIIESLEINADEMKNQCRKGFITATPLLELMIRKWNIPFRQGKVMMEKAVKYSEEEGVEKVTHSALEKALKELNMDIEISASEVEEFQDPLKILYREKTKGGIAPEAVRTNLDLLYDKLDHHRNWREKRRNEEKRAKEELEAVEQSLGF